MDGKGIQADWLTRSPLPSRNALLALGGLRIYFRQTSSFPCDKPQRDTWRSTGVQGRVVTAQHVHVPSSQSTCHPPHLPARLIPPPVLNCITARPRTSSSHSYPVTRSFMYNLHVPHPKISTGILIIVCQCWSWETKRFGGKRRKWGAEPHGKGSLGNLTRSGSGAVAGCRCCCFPGRTSRMLLYFDSPYAFLIHA